MCMFLVGRALKKQQKPRLFVSFYYELLKLIFLSFFFFQGNCFQIHFMGCSWVPDRKVGGKGKLHLSAE